MRTLIPLFACMVLLVSCKPETVVKTKDYSVFLQSKFAQQKQAAGLKEQDFWHAKLATDTGSYLYKMELAYAMLAMFTNSADVRKLHTADSLLQSANLSIGNKNSSIYFARAQTAISRHGFTEANDFIEKAATLKPDPYKLNLLRFDIALELGRYQEAESAIQSIAPRTSFDYLIRKAKWLDANGNLDSAISCMQYATKKAKATGNKSLIIWSATNLSEMLGHAGKVQDSYNGYLEVLKMDSANFYALKGIAWIAFSHDRNTKAAKRIYQWLYQQHPSPDYLLALAEIEDYEGNEQAVARYQQKFIEAVTAAEYGPMYNQYLIELYAGKPDKRAKALELAKQEVDMRKTPETINSQAWALFKMGETALATSLVNSKLNLFNHEPGAQWRTAQILATIGQTHAARTILLDLLDASFELGPLAAEQIREQLSVLPRSS